MPNHITNILDVTGPVAEVKRFRNKVYTLNKKKEEEQGDTPKYLFDFNATVPMPDSLHITSPAHTAEEKKIHAENVKKYGVGDWYDWACKFWGTKWGGYDASEPEDISGGTRFQFNTAWSPPVAWLETTSKQFPGLAFRDRWHDEGGGSGDLEGQNGKFTYNEMSDHDWYMEFDSSYREDYEFITEGDYDEVIKTYVSEEQEFNYGEMQVVFVKRVQDKDLPLLVGLELYNEAKSLIESRLKSHKKPRRKIPTGGISL